MINRQTGFSSFGSEFANLLAILAGRLLGLPPAQGHLDRPHLRLLEHPDCLGVGQTGNRATVHGEYLVAWKKVLT